MTKGGSPVTTTRSRDSACAPGATRRQEPQEKRQRSERACLGTWFAHFAAISGRNAWDTQRARLSPYPRITPVTVTRLARNGRGRRCLAEAAADCAPPADDGIRRSACRRVEHPAASAPGSVGIGPTTVQRRRARGPGFPAPVAAVGGTPAAGRAGNGVLPRIALTFDSPPGSSTADSSPPAAPARLAKQRFVDVDGTAKLRTSREHYSSRLSVSSTGRSQRGHPTSHLLRKGPGWPFVFDSLPAVGRRRCISAPRIVRSAGYESGRASDVHALRRGFCRGRHLLLRRRGTPLGMLREQTARPGHALASRVVGTSTLGRLAAVHHRRPFFAMKLMADCGLNPRAPSSRRRRGRPALTRSERLKSLNAARHLDAALHRLDTAFDVLTTDVGHLVTQGRRRVRHQSGSARKTAIDEHRASRPGKRVRLRVVDDAGSAAASVRDATTTRLMICTGAA